LERVIDDDFSIVIGEAPDGIVYLHATPLQVSVSLIGSQLFSFYVPLRVGIIVGHDEAIPSEARYTLCPARAQNSLPAFSGKLSLLLSLMLKVEEKPQLR
jgi:hypothetical protein